MEPLQAVVGDAHVVALGEGTHGTKEFFQFKHRMLEFLVEEKGFTLFAMETGFGEAQAVNDYVLNGTGDPAAAIKAMGYWTWDTEEILAMVQWMRQYNSDPSHVNKVKFYGFDMQDSPVVTQSALAYLRLVDPAYAASADTALEKFKTDNWWYGTAYDQQPDAVKQADAQAIAAVLARFDENEADYSATTGERPWALARQDVRVLAQCQGFWSISSNDSVHFLGARDSSMAENALWIQNYEGPGARIVLSAHDGHVQFDASEYWYSNMGSQLKAQLGGDMLVVGADFDRGSFQAIKNTPKVYWGPLTIFTVKPAIKTSINAALASAGIPMYVVDIRDVPTTGTGGAWWHSPHPECWVGELFNPKWWGPHNPLSASLRPWSTTRTSS